MDWNPDDISPLCGWLTEQLRGSGALPYGRVVDVQQRANAAFHSHVAHLTPIYHPEAPASAPRQVLLKRNLREPWAVTAGAREVAFYQLVVRQPVWLPMIVPCYAATYDTGSGE